MTHDDSAALVHVLATSESGDLVALVDRAREYAKSSKAATTIAAYASDWRSFTSWCASTGAPSLPSTPSAVAVYLASLADAGRRVATIERALAAIAHHHREASFEWTKGASAIREVMNGIRRRLGVAQTKKAPAIGDDLKAMIRSTAEGTIGVRDRALLTLGWFGALRRSELVALNVDDVAFVREGITINIRRSKTDQEAEGTTKAIPFASDPDACPVRALQRWLEVSQITEGPLLRSVNRGGVVGRSTLSDKTVARIVKRTAKAAGLDPTKFAGHSLRAGFATTAALRGKSLDAIMRQTGHRSERVARGYIRHATLFADNAASGLL